MTDTISAYSSLTGFTVSSATITTDSGSTWSNLVQSGGQGYTSAQTGFPSGYWGTKVIADNTGYTGSGTNNHAIINSNELGYVQLNNSTGDHLTYRVYLHGSRSLDGNSQIYSGGSAPGGTHNYVTILISPTSAHPDRPSWSNSTEIIDVTEIDSTITRVTSADDGNDTVTYSIDAASNNIFNINSSTGELTFKNSPDINSGPAVYTVTLTATNSYGSSDIVLTINLEDTIDTGSILYNIGTAVKTALSNAGARSDDYSEMTYGGGNLTLVETWTDSTKGTKLGSKAFTYQSGQLVTVVEKDGSDTTALTKTLTYDGDGSLDSITKDYA